MIHGKFGSEIKNCRIFKVNKFNDNKFYDNFLPLFLTRTERAPTYSCANTNANNGHTGRNKESRPCRWLYKARKKPNARLSKVQFMTSSLKCIKVLLITSQRRILYDYYDSVYQPFTPSKPHTIFERDIGNEIQFSRKAQTETSIVRSSKKLIESFNLSTLSTRFHVLIKPPIRSIIEIFSSKKN